jgi:hypothetical protein
LSWLGEEVELCAHMSKDGILGKNILIILILFAVVIF